MILAIDTTHEFGSIALLSDGELLEEMLLHAETGFGQILFGSIFLVGALSYARAPDHAARDSRLWMTALLIFSMVDVALGLRTLARLRRAPARLWLLAAAAWGVLSTLVVGFLVRG